MSGEHEGGGDMAPMHAREWLGALIEEGFQKTAEDLEGNNHGRMLVLLGALLEQSAIAPKRQIEILLELSGFVPRKRGR